jgi:CheY-like chemotaxis protein
MPNIDGSALTRVIRTMNPSVHIVTVSGSSNIGEHRRHPAVAGTFLAKPFTSGQLLTAIHELLTRKSVMPQRVHAE